MADAFTKTDVNRALSNASETSRADEKHGTVELDATGRALTSSW